MKNTKIFLAVLISIMIAISSTSYVSAEEDDSYWENEYEENYDYWKNKYKKDYNYWKDEYKKEKMKSKKWKYRSMKKEYMEELKPYIEALPSDTQEKLKEYMTEKKSEMEEVKEEYKNMTDEERESLKQEKMKEMEAKKAQHLAEIESIVGNSDEAKAYIAKMKELYSEAKEYKWKMKDKRKEYKEKKKDSKEKYKNKRLLIKSKYKKAFAKKLWNRLDNIPTEKLEKVVILIDKKIKTIEANSNLSEDSKEKRIAQYEALKELVNEKLNVNEEEIDLDEILN